MFSWFKNEARIELYADSFINSMRITAEMIPKVLESDAAPNTARSIQGRTERLTPSDCALLSYAGLRGWVMQAKLKAHFRARFLATIDARVTQGAVFPEMQLDALAYQEFWHAAVARAQLHDKSIWMGAAEIFLERLGAGGLHGEDALRSLPLVHSLAGLARIRDKELSRLQRRFRIV